MLMYALASRARTCMSPIIPAQPTPMLSVILKTFLATLLITKVPYEYLRSEASIAPSLQTSPTVVAPGMKPSSLINRVECGDPSPVAIKVASSAPSPVAAGSAYAEIWSRNLRSGRALIPRGMYGLFQSMGPTENLYWNLPSTRSQFQFENSKNSSHSSPSRNPECARSTFTTPPFTT